MAHTVTFLIDPGNNWIEKLLRNQENLFEIPGFDFQIVIDHSQIVGQDIVIILGYTKVLSPEFLQQNTLNLLIHESELPKGRGFSPVQWQILEGKTTIPVSLIEAVPEVDSGDIILRSEFSVQKTDLYEDIRLKQAAASFELIERFLQSYPYFRREAQSGAASFYRKRVSEDNCLDVDKTIREQMDLLRIGNNDQWPSYFYIDGEKFIIKVYREK